ncbi:MAG: alanine dehydrogenase [Kiloniellales bacterium]
MLVGVPKEIKTHEYRVGLTPTSVRELIYHGHRVMVEHDAGDGIGCDDAMYEAAGAAVVADAAEVYANAELVVKVKEPQPHECKMLREGQVLFTYLHLAADPQQTKMLLDSGCIAIAYETVADRAGRLPLLAPMSEVAGRMAIQAGARCLETELGGRGVLLGGVPGVAAAKVLIIGGGVVGTNAARMAMGLEAKVTVMDKSLGRLGEMDMQFGPMLNTIFSTIDAIEQYVLDADLVIGAVLVPGAAAPKLVSEAMVREMRRGAAVVDVAIDQGGCFATSRPTTHAEPTYVEHGVVHYCVDNMPGAVPRTSTFALNNATLPFVLTLAEDGYRRALAEDPHLRQGLNVHAGRVTYKAVADALGLDYVPAEEALRL